MKLRLAIFASLAVLQATAAVAQEDWSGIPLPPELGSTGVVRGGEFIRATCNSIVPGSFGCTDNPSAVGDVFIPISDFARSSTVDAVKNSVSALQGQVAGVQGQVASLNNFVSAANVDSRRGIAAAVAIGNAAMPSAPGRTSYDFNLATFRGHQALGLSLKHRFDTAQPLAVSVGFAAGGKNNNVAKVGLSGEF